MNVSHRMDTSAARIQGPSTGTDPLLPGAARERDQVDEPRQEGDTAQARAGQLEAILAILEAMADGVFVLDREGYLVHGNPVGRELLGLPLQAEEVPLRADVAGRLLDIRDAHGQPVPEEQWAHNRALRGETLRGMGAEDILLRTFEGREVLLNVSAAPVRDAAGQITGVVVIQRDVTERRWLERQTHEALAALLAMAEALVQAPEPPAAATAGHPGALAPSSTAHEADEAGGAPWSANATAQRLVALAQRVLGGERLSLLALDEATGAQRPIASIWPTMDEERRWWAGVPHHRVNDYLAPELLARLQAGDVVLTDLAQPPPTSAAMDWPTYGGRAALVAPMRLRERLVGLLVLSYGRDAPAVTAEALVLAGAVAKLAALVLERERLLGEREAARATALALRETNQRMDEFLGVAAHELKNPVTSSVLSVALAARRVESLLAQVPRRQSALAGQLDGLRRLLARAEANNDRLHRLVVDLLDVSRLRAGQLEFRMEPGDLAAIVREVVEEQRQIAPTRVIHLHLPASIPVPVVADADRIHQVVTNYLTNALKYAPEDRPVVVRLRVRAGQARVSVRDEGPGLPAAEQRSIWERYHRAQGVSAHAGAGGGLGLGLYVSRSIVERHQGTVGVRSAPGKGSTFWFALPLGPVDS